MWVPEVLKYMYLDGHRVGSKSDWIESSKEPKQASPIYKATANLCDFSILIQKPFSNITRPLIKITYKPEA